ncbi:MAG: antirestriction protein [Proteobacteria bacterium]|nr:antirestriction protein [Pseudomonadota bacterium]
MTDPIETSGIVVLAIAARDEQEVLDRHFGTMSPLIECAVHMQASRLCRRIKISRVRWRYYEFSGHGLYMAPDIEDIPVQDDRDGFQCTLSSHAFGIATSLLAFSRFAGVGDGCMEKHASSLLELAIKHPETELIRQTVAGRLI